MRRVLDNVSFEVGPGEKLQFLATMALVNPLSSG